MHWVFSGGSSVLLVPRPSGTSPMSVLNLSSKTAEMDKRCLANKLARTRVAAGNQKTTRDAVHLKYTAGQREGERERSSGRLQRKNAPTTT